MSTNSQSKKERNLNNFVDAPQVSEKNSEKITNMQNKHENLEACKIFDQFIGHDSVGADIALCKLNQAIFQNETNLDKKTNNVTDLDKTINNSLSLDTKSDILSDYDTKDQNVLNIDINAEDVSNTDTKIENISDIYIKVEKVSNIDANVEDILKADTKLKEETSSDNLSFENIKIDNVIDKIPFYDTIIIGSEKTDKILQEDAYNEHFSTKNNQNSTKIYQEDTKNNQNSTKIYQEDTKNDAVSTKNNQNSTKINNKNIKVAKSDDKLTFINKLDCRLSPLEKLKRYSLNDWICLVFKVAGFIPPLCEVLEKTISKSAFSHNSTKYHGNALTHFDEVIDMIERKRVLVNLYVVYKQYKNQLNGDEMDTLKRTVIKSKKISEIAKQGCYRPVYDAKNKIIARLHEYSVVLGYDPDWFYKSFASLPIVQYYA